MNLSNLKPASEFAKLYGIKSIVYGPPGSAKTPIINTCPKPVLLACEPGLLSMRGSNVPTCQAFTAKAIDDFFEWVFNSNEIKNFDTVAVDSASQMCEIYVDEALKTNKHGLAAYGEMARNVLKHLERLYFLQYKHTYLIAKQETVLNNNASYKRPYYPGRELPIKMPHKYDCILHLDVHAVPGVGQVRSFQCIGSLDIMARDRTGRLAEFEEPNFNNIVIKGMS